MCVFSSSKVTYLYGKERKRKYYKLHKAAAASNISTSSSDKLHPKHPNNSSACLGVLTSTIGTPPLATT